ncbi:hypothetical protein MNL76_04935 [Fervidobacterium riparium]
MLSEKQNIPLSKELWKEYNVEYEFDVDVKLPEEDIIPNVEESSIYNRYDFDSCIHLLW